MLLVCDQADSSGLSDSEMTPSPPNRWLRHSLDDDGGLVLRGDANQQEDSAAVAAEDVRGVGVLRVPWVGLPYVWAAEGRYLSVGLAALGVLALITVSPIRDRRPSDLDGDTGTDVDTGTPGPTEPSHVKARHAVVAATLLLVAGGEPAPRALLPPPRSTTASASRPTSPRARGRAKRTPSSATSRAGRR